MAASIFARASRTRASGYNREPFRLRYLAKTSTSVRHLTTFATVSGAPTMRVAPDEVKERLVIPSPGALGQVRILLGPLLQGLAHEGGQVAGVFSLVNP